MVPLLAVLALPSCFYAGGHHWRIFTRQNKETIDIPDTLGVPRLRQQLADRASQSFANLEVWTAVDWNERLRREGKNGGVATRDRYRLAPGDRISVQVADEKDLSKDYYIRPDGTFSFPMLDEVNVEGKTIPEVQDLLRRGLLDLMKDPKVTVNLEQGPTRIGTGNTSSPDFGDILVFGEVGGGVVATGSGGGIGGRVMSWSGKETLLKILAKGGGLSSNANWRNVAVFRREADPEDPAAYKTIVIVSDMSNYFKRVDQEQDIPLKVNDVVFVPTQPEYPGVAFKHDWDLLLSYLSGVVSYDEFVRRTSDSSRLLPRSSPHGRGEGD